MRKSRIGALFAALLVVVGCASLAGTSQAATGQTIWGTSTSGINTDPDTAKSVIGTQFRVAKAGTVDAVKIHRSNVVTGALTAKVARGSTVLATVAVPAAGAGWQVVDVAPISVVTGQTYTVYYTAPAGRYSVKSAYTWPKVSGDLTAVKGVYTYGTGVPSLVYNNENYWVDVVFNPASVVPPTTSSASPSPTTTTVPTTTVEPTTSGPTTPPVTTTTTNPPPVAGFPDADTTGWAHTGVTLTAVPGQATSGPGWEWNGAPFNYVKITGANAVLDGLDISGCVYVDTGVVSATITRSRISGNCNYLIRRYSNDSGSLTVRDTELVGGAVQVQGANFTWTRVNAHHFTGKAAMLGSNSVVEGSYIHDNQCNPPDHQSAVGTNGGASNMVIRGNTIDFAPTECTSGGISNYDDFGPFHNLLIEGNLINSAGYCLKAGFEDNNAAGNTGERVIGNTFGRKYYAECGSFGVVSNWMPSVEGNEWSGNVWGDGPAASGSHAVGDTVNP